MATRNEFLPRNARATRFAASRLLQNSPLKEAWQTNPQQALIYYRRKFPQLFWGEQPPFTPIGVGGGNF
jgi:hypothetical protein